ncbi:MAG: 50S ribosomal protein L23 [Ignavibacteriae bacterium]|nr:50S ribosomal protein L23 [Ignavibacteria bacterium]MBI3364484.1 50S ribosomal protein L23 [Ignavibacteriota bacterium]
MTGIVFRPIVTEKLTNLQDKGTYAFEVDPRANKIEIARAISKKFNVTVIDVRTMNYKGKAKTQMTRRGRFEGKTTHFKKAIVILKEGESINLFENI